MQVLLVFAALGLFMAMPDQVMIELRAQQSCSKIASSGSAVGSFGSPETLFLSPQWGEWYTMTTPCVGDYMAKCTRVQAEFYRSHWQSGWAGDLVQQYHNPHTKWDLASKQNWANSNPSCCAGTWLTEKRCVDSYGNEFSCGDRGSTYYRTETITCGS